MRAPFVSRSEVVDAVTIGPDRLPSTVRPQHPARAPTTHETLHAHPAPHAIGVAQAWHETPGTPTTNGQVRRDPRADQVFRVAPPTGLEPAPQLWDGRTGALLGTMLPVRANVPVTVG